MKGYYRHILLASAVIMAAAACTKHPEPDAPALADNAIRLSAAEDGATKALLDNGAFKTNGNRIRVYDFVTDGTTTTKHIDSYAGPDVVSTSPLHVQGTTWPFTDEIDGTEADVKQWIPGTHKFFGYLAKDVSSGTALTPEGLFGGSFSFDDETQTLTIPSTTMTAGTPQFDFMYSNIVTTEPINEPVDLEFSHLFTAVSFGIVNDASNSVTINSFSITLYNTQSAEIKYSATGIPEYSKTATSPPTYRSATSLGTLEGMADGVSDKWVNAFNISATDKEYILMWPHTEDELANCKVNISYTLNNDNSNQSLAFPAMALKAGERYHFDIFIADKAPIRINYLVVDWTEIKNEYTFE